MKKVNNFLNEKKGYFLSFFIPLLILLFLFTSMKVFFFDKYNLLISDFYGQYYSLFSYLRNALVGDGSLWYSFSNGLGGGMISTIAYYLVSPFNLFIVFFPDKYLLLAMELIIVLKIATCGLTMYSYLHYHYPKKSWVPLVMFSSCYALMAYVACYYFHIMWLDGVYLLPLVCLGIDRIIQKKKPLVYGISLFAAILCNYYIGYMICIFSVIYFCYRLFVTYTWKSNKREMLETFVQFAITSLVSGLCTFMLMIPTLFAMIDTNKTSIIGDFGNLTIDIPFAIYFSKLTLGAHNIKDIFVNEGCLVYCGIIVFILSILYFFNRKISKREKWLSFGVIAIFLLSFSVNYVNLVWHGFARPMCFYDRFSFIYCFFLIVLAARSFFSIQGLEKIHFWIMAPILPLGFLSLLFYQFDYVKFYSVYITLGFYFLYLLLLYCYIKYKEKKIHRLLNVLLCCLVLGELLLNWQLSFDHSQIMTQRENYDSYDTYQMIKERVNREENEPFYRMETDLYSSHNDALLYHYHGINTFLSTFSLTQLNFYQNLGFLETSHSIQYRDGVSPLFDALVGLRYIVTSQDMPYYEVIDSFPYSVFSTNYYGIYYSPRYIYQNPYALSLGFLASSDVKTFEQDFLLSNGINYFTYQNYLMNSLVENKQDIFQQANVQSLENNKYLITIQNEDDLYLRLILSMVGLADNDFTFYIDGEEYANLQYPEVTNFIYIKNDYEIGDTIELEIRSHTGLVLEHSPLVYSFNLDAFQKHIEELKQQPMELITYANGYVQRKVKVTSEKNVLFTSIPYEKGWQIKVDGKKVEGLKLAEGLLGVELTEGEYTVEFTYYVPGLTLGCLISFASLLCAIFYYRHRHKIDSMIANLYLKHEEIWNYLIVGALTTIVNVVVYAIFAKLLSVHYMVSTIIAWILSVLFAYVANKKAVFKTKVKDRKELWKEMGDFFKFRVLSLFLEMGSMYLLVSLLSLQDLLSKILVNIMVIVANYFFSKLFIFKKENKKEE